jgi:ABC-type sugar transport system ATPase subunit
MGFERRVVASLHVKNLKIVQGDFQLEVSNFSLKSGNFLGVLGASGAGKSTLLHAIAGLSECEGEIWLDKKPLHNLKPHLREIGMVFQSPVLMDDWSVEENLRLLLKVKKAPKATWDERIQKALKNAQASHLLKSRVSWLSGGERQRIGIAQSLLFDPKVLLMDEPFSALDPSLRRDLQEMIRGLAKKSNIAVLFVTHDRDEAFELCDELMVLEKGRVLQIGSPKELYESPKTVALAKYMEPHGLVALGKDLDNLFGLKLKNVKLPCYAYIPPRAIINNKEGVLWEVEQTHYVDGRFLVRFANGLRTFWTHAPDKFARVDLDWSAVRFLRNENE